MADTPALTVVVVHWDQPTRCAATLDAFRGQGLPVRFVVVDNGSRPDPVAALRALAASAPDVELVELAMNAGFGPGANAGLRRWLDTPADDAAVNGHGTTELDAWVALAPHDALPQPGCLRAVLDEVASRPRSGLACADVGDGHVPVVDPYFGGMTVPAKPGSGWQDAGYPHGTLLFARRACLAEVGVFDERYFAYCEEADLGIRARRAGWEVGLIRGARVVNPHLGGRTDEVDYLMLRNTLLLVRSHFGRYHAFMRAVIAIIHLVDGTLRPSRRPWIFAPAARVRALADFARGRFGPPPAGLSARAGRTPTPPGPRAG